MVRYCEKCSRFYYNSPSVGAAVLVIKRGKILLVKRKVSPSKGKWALPGGFMEQGESVENAALRELKEETGITGKNAEIISVFNENVPVFGTVVAAGVMVTGIKGTLRAGDDAEEAAFFNINKKPPVAFVSHRRFVKEAAGKYAAAKNRRKKGRK